MIAAVADDPLSRRNLLRFDFAGLRRVERPDPEPFKASLAWRWERGASALHRAWEPLAPVLCEVAAFAAGELVLDAGCGDGNVALEAARRGAVVTACDVAPGQLGRARERVGADAVEWVVADVESLPMEDDSFEAVISAYGAAFSPNPRRTARELLRVLRPGGPLVLAVPAPRSLFTAVLELAQSGPGAIPPGLPSPASWGRRDLSIERFEAVAPGCDVEVFRHTLRLGFESEEAAWNAFSVAFGLEVTTRDDFADLVAARSESLARVEIDEPVNVIIARRFW